MSRNLSVVRPEANSIAAASCQQRRISAEPLCFALICRHVWGANATKELQFILDRSERTSRAWASGDSLPQVDTLIALLLSEHGRVIFDYITQNDIAPAWWLALMRAERIVTAEDQIDRN